MATPESAVNTTPAENSGRNSGQFQKNNVFRFPSGVSPNPGGRPKKTPLSTALTADLERRIPADATKLRRLAKSLFLSERCTFAQLIARALVIRAIKETSAASEVADRVEGKPKQPMEYSGVDGSSIDIRVTYEDAEPKA